MGPYYLTALVALLGPVRRVTGATRISFPERTITSQPRHGDRIKVDDTPTHVSALLDFVGGPVATMIMSFDVWSHHLPHIEIYGSEGTLSVPDPNTFHGPVYLRRAQESSWQEIPLTHGYSENSRGIGLADMAYAMCSGRQHRANGHLAYHVLDMMQAIHEASASNKHILLNSLCEQPAPLTPGMPTWQEDR
jgi:predicted dehydrogenase